MKTNRMLKFLTVLFAFVAAFALVGCGDREAADNDPEEAVKGESNVLVAYFSWSGNTRQIARWIAEKTGGELFRIVPEDAYSNDEVFDRSKNELDNGIRPALAEHIDEEVMSGYDIVFVGFPIWWYDLPMPVWTFLEEYDFSGKTVIPFFTHNGSSGGAGSISTVARLCPDSNVLTDKFYTHSGNSVSGAESSVDSWLNGLGLDFGNK